MDFDSFLKTRPFVSGSFFLLAGSPKKKTEAFPPGKLGRKGISLKIHSSLVFSLCCLCISNFGTDKPKKEEKKQRPLVKDLPLLEDPAAVANVADHRAQTL